MKPILRLLFFLLISFKLFSQPQAPVSKLVYLDSVGAETSAENSKYSRLVEGYFSDKERYSFKEFYKSSAVKLIGTTLNKDIIKRDGQFISYYENGKKQSVQNYSNGKKVGKEFNWYENGNIKSEIEYVTIKKNKEEVTEAKINNFWNPEKEQTVKDGNGQMEESQDHFYEKGEIKNGQKNGVWEGKNLKRKYSFTESYSEGVFISGTSTDENGNKFDYKTILEKPFPAKGIAHFYRFLGNRYQIPKVEGLSGKVYVGFVIDEDGNPTKLRILRDIGYGTGEEAVKTIVSYGKWVPGKNRGMPVAVLYSIPITIQTKGRTNSIPPYENEINNTGNGYQEHLLKNF
ncbi:energy transducer TonB [Flavobacterium daemonense]|uniref:energy transducer TonB n=1 Tax=Flavobacterium daemonense TaxID=1393049 RepID=UPI00118561D8|nr:energy transducer TonB [Flavobacterium daemonense]KAF2334406.1 energy transducer TonB [Flavobacterium daemonense]